MHIIWSVLLVWSVAEAGEIQGRVLDCQKRTVPKLEVCYQTAAGESGSPAATVCTRTSPQGEFRFHQLPPGTYGVFVSGDRWRTLRYRGIRVESGQTVDLIFKLTQPTAKKKGVYGKTILACSY